MNMRPKANVITIVRKNCLAAKPIVKQREMTAEDAFKPAPGGDENPVLTKIKAMLSATKPEKWIQFAEDLGSDKGYPKPLENWERVYVLDLPNGLLAVRSSQPVRCDYFSGGYTVFPAGTERFTIELRQKTWSPKGLVDPYHFSSSTNQLQYQILLDGEDARKLFFEVQRILQEHDEGRKGSFITQARSLEQNLISRLRQVSASEWQRESAQEGVAQYKAIIDGLHIALIKVLDENENSSYYLWLSSGEHSWEGSDHGLAREAFELVDSIYREAALLSFSEVLEGVTTDMK